MREGKGREAGQHPHGAQGNGAHWLAGLAGFAGLTRFARLVGRQGSAQMGVRTSNECVVVLRPNANRRCCNYCASRVVILFG